MTSLEDLREMYEAFCAFGGNRNLTHPTASMENLSGPTMDGAKFAKFARDNKLIDNKRVTSTDVDIIFGKIKPKGGRKIDWNMFLEGLTQIAEKRYPGKKGRQALDLSVAELLKRGSGPIASGTVPVQSDATVNRLTDTTKYTGTHKLRFDEAGRGRGAEGRDKPSQTDSLAKITNREESSVRGLPISVDPNVAAASPSASASTKRGHASVVTASSEKLDIASSRPKSTRTAPKASTRSTNDLTGSNDEKAYNTSGKGGSSVFDRLTNTTQYTGTHKKRFNADGSGRGIDGRDSPSKGGAAGKYRGGDVKDLSQILRS